MFIGFGVSWPICWKPGIHKGKWGWRAYWLVFEVAVLPSELMISMLKFHVEQIKEEIRDDRYVVYYPLGKEPDFSTNQPSE